MTKYVLGKLLNNKSLPTTKETVCEMIAHIMASNNKEEQMQ